MFDLLLTLVRIREVPGDVNVLSRLQRGLGLPPGHPAWRRRAERVQEVQFEVAPLGKVEADVRERGRRRRQQQQQERDAPHHRGEVEHCKASKNVPKSQDTSNNAASRHYAKMALSHLSSVNVRRNDQGISPYMFFPPYFRFSPCLGG